MTSARQSIGERDRPGAAYPLEAGTRPRTGESDPLARSLGWLSIGLGLAQLAAPDKGSRWIGLEGDHPVLMRGLGLREIACGIGILNRSGPGWLWSRVAGDTMDMLLLGAALAADGNDRGRVLSAAAGVFGVAALDVLAARRLEPDGRRPQVRERAVTINRPVEEVYRFWRDLNNLPRFMVHLESVRVIDERRSHWTAAGPAGTHYEWDSEITEERPDQLLRWRSVAGSEIENYGSVRFTRAPGGRGTEIHVRLMYHAPGGALGVGAARLFGRESGQQVKGDLARLKQVLETGEVVHSDSSIHRGMHPAQPSGRSVVRRLLGRSSAPRRQPTAAPVEEEETT